MGQYVYAVRAQSKKLKMNNTSINVRLAKYLCKKDQNDQNGAIENASTNYNKKGVADYIILGDDMKDVYGSTVYTYGSDSGVFLDDSSLGVVFMPVGIVIGKPRAWYIETNKKVVENLHRQKEYAKMKAGLLFIGEFGNDYNAYEEYLHSKDKIAQEKGEEIYFRGYLL